MKKNKLNLNLAIEPHKYPEDFKKIYFKLNLENRKKYTKWIEEISKSFSNDIDWWGTIPPSRNYIYSDILKNITILETLKKISKKYKNIEVLSTSKELLDIIHDWSKRKNLDITSKILKEKSFNLKNIKYILSSFIFNLVIFFYINIFIKKINLKNKPPKNIVLIDMFATESVLNGKIIYNNLDVYLKKKSKKNVFFVPSFVIEKNIIKILMIINSLSDKNYIFKEHYLNLKDVIYSCFHFKRKKKFLIKYKNFKEWDLTKLLHVELKNNINTFSEQNCLLNYFFSKQLMLNKIKIKKVINWFENQPIDKGWNMGFRKFHKNTESLGYQGFLNYAQYMNTYPTSYEEKKRVIPKKIISIGRAYIKLKKEFFPKANIVLGPALNYNKVFKDFKKTNKIKILVILSGIKHLDKATLEWIIFVLKKDTKINITIKPHPMLKIDNIIDVEKTNLKNQINISSQVLSELLKKTNIAICSGPTGGTIESIAYNCFLISLVFDPCDAINLNSLRLNKKYFKLVSNKEYLYKLVKLIYDKNKNFKSNKKIKNFLFEKITDKNMKIFHD